MGMAAIVLHGKPAGKNIDLAKSYGADLQKHGFPFLTILDANGKVLATSNPPEKSNIGFPAKPEEIAYFQTMLGKAVTTITLVEVDALLASLAIKPSPQSSVR